MWQERWPPKCTVLWRALIGMAFTGEPLCEPSLCQGPWVGEGVGDSVNQTHTLPSRILGPCGSDETDENSTEWEEVIVRRQIWRLLRKFHWRRLHFKQICKFCGLETRIEKTVIYWGSTLASHPDAWGRFQFIIDSSVPRRERQYWDWISKSLLMFEDC